MLICRNPKNNFRPSFSTLKFGQFGGKLFGQFVGAHLLKNFAKLPKFGKKLSNFTSGSTTSFPQRLRSMMFLKWTLGNWDSPRSGVDVTNIFNVGRIAILCRNIAFWLVITRHATCNIQSRCSISVQHSTLCSNLLMISVSGESPFYLFPWEMVIVSIKLYNSKMKHIDA